MSVSEISGALKRTVEGAFSRVRVRGEISGWKRAASGHCYFSLKDDKAVLDAILWRGSAERLAFAPEDGAEVIATGKLTTYPGRSKYQISVDALELAGEGALMALLDKRRRALAAEGLFDTDRKKPLPYIPRTIGVVTSPTGAVIRDILHRLEDRFPTHVIVWPVPVQGEGAAQKIAAAIRGFDALDGTSGVPRPDLVIVARGGGSIEDLWAFNEEVVVRAAAECAIPLVSAVGHETDTTLVDFASDKRAPTPTAAAEMAVPVRRELIAYVAEQGARAFQALSQRIDRRAERLVQAGERWPAPDALLATPSQRLDEAQRRLGQGLRSRADEAGGRLASWTGRLDPERLLLRPLDTRFANLAQLCTRMGQGLTTRARRGEEQLARFSDRLAPGLAGSVKRADALLASWTGRLSADRLLDPLADRHDERLGSLAKQLALLDPRRSPREGFVLVTDDEDVALCDAASARRAQFLKLHYPDGTVRARTRDTAAPRRRKVAKTRRTPYRPPQPGLFDAPGDEED